MIFYSIEFLKVSYNKGITMAFNITFSNITQISGSYLLTSMVVDLNFSWGKWKVWSWSCPLSFSIVISFFHDFMPGSEPNQFYVCLTRVPEEHWKEETKMMWSFFVIILFSFLAHIFTGLRYLVYKYQEKQKINPGTHTITTKYFIDLTLTNLI